MAARALTPAAPTPSSRVPVEFVGQARLLRTRISTSQAKAAIGIEGILRQLRPRAGFTPMPQHVLMGRLALNWRRLPPFGRLSYIGEFEGGTLALAEIRCAPAAMRFPGWVGAEPAIALWSIAVVTTPPRYAEQRRHIADIGLHALARRLQRSSPDDRREARVFADFLPLVAAHGNAVTAGSPFSIATGGGGVWLGAVTAVNSAPVWAVRTYKD